MATQSPSDAPKATADLVLEATTPFGRRWTSSDVPASTRVLRDPAHLLGPGDVITVRDARSRQRRFLLLVRDRDGDYARLRWLGRDG